MDNNSNPFDEEPGNQPPDDNAPIFLSAEGGQDAPLTDAAPSIITPVIEKRSGRLDPAMGIIGASILGCCLLIGAFSLFRYNQRSLVDRYVPSSAATQTLTISSDPTIRSTSNLTATQAAWVKPAKPPTLGSEEDTRTALEQGIEYLEAYSITFPAMPEINQPGDIYVFEIPLEQPQPLIWSYGWCATSKEILDENFEHLELVFILNETSIPLNQFAIVNTNREDGSSCREYASLIELWVEGQHHLEIQITFTQPTNDGWDTYPAGTHTVKYIVTANQ